ncbi:MAG: SDR family NAD(P)-dependent oxidoreductase [Deltaproteobacteria bacterium]|nr:SDR family NAD(P)-dependent oxidoreductase [Deltaproteobacteria bacterium]
MSKPVALVSGANRGIGRRVAERLAADGYRVLVGSRVLAAGEAVAGRIRATGGDAEAVSLDVADDASVAAAAASLPALDALVNNAGVALDGFDAEVVRRTLAVNTYGAHRLTHAVRDKLVSGARVVNVSSGLADEAGLQDVLRERFADPGLDEAGLLALLQEFEAAVAAGRHGGAGWPSSAYRISKVGLNALTRIWARSWGDLYVNSACPGWVRTDMGGAGAPRSLDEGADTIVWLAEGPAARPTGGYFRDRAPAGW